MTKPEDLIVGKSVEEIEAEQGNRVNSPVQGEDRQEQQRSDTVLIPAGVQSGVGINVNGAPGAGVVGGLPGVITTLGGQNGAGSEDGRGDKQTDSSEE